MVSDNETVSRRRRRLLSETILRDRTANYFDLKKSAG
jgi:hypothetical protein